jgi:hypothetical protein
MLSRTQKGWENGVQYTHTTTYSYNAQGKILTINPPGNGTADVVTYSYDPQGTGLFPESRTDPGPDPNGNWTRVTEYEYDGFNRLKIVRDPNQVAYGGQTEHFYDIMNRRTKTIVTASDGSTSATEYFYTKLGDLEKIWS